jgi:Na+-transporting NADH:ubiquinone oxidoreductase subunit A
MPLMRALSIGDVEAAENLGCLELIEEDVVSLTQICTSGADYGALLRHMLDELDTVS